MLPECLITIQLSNNSNNVYSLQFLHYNTKLAQKIHLTPLDRSS